MATNPLNPFENAPLILREIKDHVTSQQNDLIERANDTRSNAASAISSIAASLANIKVDFYDAPKPPVFPKSTITYPDLGDLKPDTFGEISELRKDTFKPDKVDYVDKDHIDDFDPEPISIVIPDAPIARPDPLFPDAPVFGEIGLPTKPSGERPIMPDLVELVIPTFTFQPIAPFNETSPEFTGSSVSAVLQWAETPYVPVIIEEEMAVLRRMWDGGTGLPLAVEQAMWERAASREDVAIARDISAAAIEFSGRGFTLPPGMLANRIDTIRSEGALKKQELGREVMIKVADTHIENLRFACQQAIASENVLIGLWGQMAQRQFDAAKAQLDGELALLNANIAIFNAKQTAYSTAASVHRIALEERTLELQAYKTSIEAEIAKGQLNEQRLKVFLGLYEGLKVDAELYKTDMQGAQLQADLQKSEVEKFKAMIEAGAEKIKADKLRYDAYESRIKGEAAKASILEAQARAYAAYVSGKTAHAEVNIQNQRADLQLEDLKLRAFLANLDADKAKIVAEGETIKAGAEAHRIAIQRYIATATAQTALTELDIKAFDMEMRTDLSVYDAEIRKHSAAMEQQIRSASLQADGLKAIGQMHSTLAAGAMAGISLGASIGATASTSASGSSTVTQSM